MAGLTAGTFYPLTLSFVLRNLPQNYLPFGIMAYAIDIVVTTHVAHSYEGLGLQRSFVAMVVLDDLDTYTHHDLPSPSWNCQTASA